MEGTLIFTAVRDDVTNTILSNFPSGAHSLANSIATPPWIQGNLSQDASLRLTALGNGIPSARGNEIQYH